MSDHARSIEVEAALQSVYFATRHLDQAATLLQTAGVPWTHQERLAIARAQLSNVLTGLAECLSPASEQLRIADDAVPF